LGRASATLLSIALLLAAADARAGDTVNARAFSEIGAYQDSVAVSVLTPSVGATVESPTAGWGANALYLVDMVSAASPDIVATASKRWSEVRHAGNVGARYKPGTFGVSVAANTSYTPDYLALGASGRVTQELDEKNLTLTAGYGYGHDTIGRTGTPWSVFSNQLDYHSFVGGLSRVVNNALVLSGQGEVIVERGDQSKPYRFVPMFAPSVAPTIPPGASVDQVANARIAARPLEQLPLARERYALTVRMALRLDASTIRLEQRGYVDSWEQRATTTDFRWMFDAGKRVIWWPRLRLHAQNGASFWQRAYASTGPGDLPALRTGDRELSPLVGATGGGGVRLALGAPVDLDGWVLTATGEGTHTWFLDTIYVKNRWSALVAVGLEVGF
jgi:hypothetical protein